MTLRVTTAVRDALRPDNGQYVSVKDDVLRQAHNKWLHLWGTHQEAIGNLARSLANRGLGDDLDLDTTIEDEATAA